MELRIPGHRSSRAHQFGLNAQQLQGADDTSNQTDSPFLQRTRAKCGGSRFRSEGEPDRFLEKGKELLIKPEKPLIKPATPLIKPDGFKSNRIPSNQTKTLLIKRNRLIRGARRLYQEGKPDKPLKKRKRLLIKPKKLLIKPTTLLIKRRKLLIKRTNASNQTEPFD